MTSPPPASRSAAPTGKDEYGAWARAAAERARSYSSSSASVGGLMGTIVAAAKTGSDPNIAAARSRRRQGGPSGSGEHRSPGAGRGSDRRRRRGGVGRGGRGGGGRGRRRRG